MKFWSYCAYVDVYPILQHLDLPDGFGNSCYLVLIETLNTHM